MPYVVILLGQLTACSTSARMLLVTEPPMEGQGVWATALAAQFEQHLRAWLGHKRSGVRTAFKQRQVAAM